MAKIVTASVEDAGREPRGGGLFSSIGGPQFFLAQIFTILATVLGVYLAGYVGFQRTLEYDRYVNAKQGADLLTAIHEELKQNLVRLRKFNERLPAEVGDGVAPEEWPRLRLFVWEAAGRSSSAFNIPPQILTDLQGFYEDIGDALKNPDMREAFQHLTSTNTQDRTVFKQQLTERLNAADTSIMGGLEKEAAASEQLLKKYADPSRGAP